MCCKYDDALNFSELCLIWEIALNIPQNVLYFLQLRIFRGHANEKNFVGLSVNSEYLACGSETNEVYAYHKVHIRWIHTIFVY